MKKAKVKNGVIQHVWPNTKPDGRVQELPIQYQGLRGKAVPDCIIDVPDNVEPKWVWNGTEYAPIVKKKPAPPHSDLLAVLCERLNLPYEEIWQEVKRRKAARNESYRKEK